MSRYAHNQQIFCWIMQHRPLWKDWPTVLPDPEAALQFTLHGGTRPTPMPSEVKLIMDEIKKKCVAGLQEAGLISPRTDWRDVDINRHIVRLRKMWRRKT